MKRICCLILLFVSLLLYCPASAVATAEVVELKQGQELFQAGDLNQALAVLRSFVQQSPDSVETAQASALIGRIFTRQHNYADAILYLQRVPTIFQSPEIELLLGNALVETGQYAAGLKQLQPLGNEPLNQADKSMLYRALTVASTAKQQFLLTLVYLQQQLPFSPNPAEIFAQAHQLLQSHISDADLAEAAFMWQETAIAGLWFNSNLSWQNNSYKNYSPLQQRFPIGKKLNNCCKEPVLIVGSAVTASGFFSH